MMKMVDPLVTTEDSSRVHHNRPVAMEVMPESIIGYVLVS